MKRIDQINSRGFANGWHAQMLRDEAKHNGETMAECFRRKAEKSQGFNVPAKCTKVTKNWIFYEFLDGSIDRYPNQSGEI